MITVIGYYTTKFGELWERSLYSLTKEAVDGVLKNTNLEMGQIDAIFYSNMLAGVLENNLHSVAKFAEMYDMHLPVFHVEAACASGGMAMYMAAQYLKANPGKTVLVVGAEKMTDYSPEETTQALSAAASGEEQEAGLTFPGAYGMIANVYLHKYGYGERELAYVPHKNHFHGTLNDKAQFQKEISVEAVLKSTVVAAPLKILDCSPISDGASALIMTSDKKRGMKGQCAELAATEIATDSISLKHRKYLDRIEATQLAAGKAYATAGITPADIGVAEVHDCFSIAELLAMEDLGFWERGSAGKKIKDLSTMYGNGGSLIVNTSGGLKASGHPVGATGIKQVGEIYLQLTNQATKRQVKRNQWGLAHNVGGSGGTAVVSILKQL